MISIDLEKFFKKLITRVFDSPDIYIYENIQNAQRSRATSLHVATDGRTYIRFVDDGDGCDDYRKLFRHSASGWDSDLVEAEGANGEGFFANVACFREVVVESRHFRAVVDRERIIQGDLQGAVTICNLPERIDGFRITCRDPVPGVDISPEAIREVLMEAGRYVGPRVYFDGKCVQEEWAKSRMNVPFSIKVKARGFTGWLAPRVGPHTYVSGASAELFKSKTGVVLYYQDRFVMELLEVPDVQGELFIENGFMTPRSPDRRSFIKDGSWVDFVNKLYGYQNTIIKNVLREGSDDVHTDLAPLLQKASIRLLRKYVRFTRLEGKSFTSLREDSEEDLSEGADLPGLFSEVNRIAAPEDHEITERRRKESALVEALNDSKSRLELLEHAANDGRTTLNKLGRAGYCWVRDFDVKSYPSQMARALECDIPVLIADSDFHATILVRCGIPHLREMGANIKRSLAISDTRLRKGEKHILSCLKYLGETVHEARGVQFVFGKLKACSKLNGITVEESVPIAMHYEGKVYIHRTWKGADKIDSLWVVNWFIRNSLALAHELAHYAYGTADHTVYHYERQCQIHDKILRAIAGWNASWSGAGRVFEEDADA